MKCSTDDFHFNDIKDYCLVICYALNFDKNESVTFHLFYSEKLMLDLENRKTQQRHMLDWLKKIQNHPEICEVKGIHSYF